MRRPKDRVFPLRKALGARKKNSAASGNARDALAINAVDDFARTMCAMGNALLRSAAAIGRRRFGGVRGRGRLPANGYDDVHALVSGFHAGVCAYAQAV